MGIDAQQTKVVITDQQGTEYTVQPLTEYNPVKGQAIQINQNYLNLIQLNSMLGF
jgi:hypothetical protein